MKKVLFVLSLILICLSSCKKDEVALKYTQEKLNGTWVNLVVTDGITQQLVITSTSLSEVSVTAAGSISLDYDTYSFDGAKITCSVSGFADVLTINELTNAKLVLTRKLSGEKLEYKKVK